MSTQVALPFEGGPAAAPTLFTASAAVIDASGLYRYSLTRCWGSGPRALWIMLNPSTADAETDDPTIRRVTSFTRREGFDGFDVVNLFGLRATKPGALWGHPDPVGPDNDRYLHGVARAAARVIVAWGADGGGFGVVKDSETRDRVVCRWLRANGVTPYCLGTTAKGHPRHPLYVRGDAPLVPFILREEKGTARW